MTRTAGEINMKVGVAKEIAPGERRVALVPESIEKLRAAGISVFVERGAGVEAAFPDSAYVEAGARIVAAPALYSNCDVILRINRPTPAETKHAHAGQVIALAELPPGEGPREDLEQIEQAADRAAGLTRQLLAFARRTVLKPKVVELAAIVRHLEPLLTRLIGEDVRLVTIAADGSGYVLADPGQLEQVIVNLVVNARDAMPDGGALTIEIGEIAATEAPESPSGAWPAGPMVTLCVTDTGVGMEADTLDRVFEPFFTTKGPGKGTGLGLAQVYGIVQASGGTVTARR